MPGDLSDVCKLFNNRGTPAKVYFVPQFQVKVGSSEVVVGSDDITYAEYVTVSHF